MTVMGHVRIISVSCPYHLRTYSYGDGMDMIRRWYGHDVCDSLFEH